MTIDKSKLDLSLTFEQLFADKREDLPTWLVPITNREHNAAHSAAGVNGWPFCEFQIRNAAKAKQEPTNVRRVLVDSDGNLPKWLVPITDAEYKKANRLASEGKWKLCNFAKPATSSIVTKDGTVLTVNRGDGGNKREQQRKAASSAGKLERAAEITVPEHLKVTRYESPEWEKMLRLAGESTAEAWKLGKGMAYHLWGESQELRQNTFEGWEPEDFIKAILDLNTDPKMAPIEEKFASKFGSYKALPYEEWADNVHDLWMDVPWNPDVQTLEWAKREVVAELQQAMSKLGWDKIQPLSVTEALPKVTKGRNSGWPYFTSKWHLRNETLEYYVGKAEQLLDGEPVLSGCPHVLFKRVQPNGPGTPKMRPVECPPKFEAIAAKCLTDRFIDLFKTMTPYSGFNGGERVHEVLAPFMEMEYLVESDFSKFDQRVVHLMPHVFQVVMKVVPQKYWRYLQLTLDYYQNAQLLTPIGVISAKDGRRNGLMSGEGWTSVIGTLANSIAVKYTMKRMGIEKYLRLSFGDDIALATDEPFSIDLFERYMLELGMDCNKTKQNLSSGPQAYFSFLGWYHFRDDWKSGNQGKFPMCRIAPKLFYREFFLTVDSVEASEEVSEEVVELLRQTPIGIDIVAIASKINLCRNNVDFTKLVELVRENSPHKLSTEYIIPLEEVALAIRDGRHQRNLGLANQPVVRELYKIEQREGKFDTGWSMPLPASNTQQPSTTVETEAEPVETTTIKEVETQVTKDESPKLFINPVDAILDVLYQI